MNFRLILIPVAGAILAAGCSSHTMSNATAATSPAARTSSRPAKPAIPALKPASSETTKFIWEDIRFAFDDASLNNDARDFLSDAGAYLMKHPRKIEIQGNCDERGSVEYNLALGERRARAAKSFLTSYGVSEGAISTLSFGKEKPLDPGHNESAWARNRRDHFVEATEGS